MINFTFISSSLKKFFSSLSSKEYNKICEIYTKKSCLIYKNSRYKKDNAKFNNISGPYNSLSSKGYYWMAELDLSLFNNVLTASAIAGLIRILLVFYIYHLFITFSTPTSKNNRHYSLLIIVDYYYYNEYNNKVDCPHIILGHQFFELSLPINMISLDFYIKKVLEHQFQLLNRYNPVIITKYTVKII